MTEVVLRNAKIIGRTEVFDGAVKVANGLIDDVSAGATEMGQDMEGDYLIPGLVELHTDHLEGHYMPRPGVRWNMKAAIQAHDAQIAGSGITTVFDCVRLGSDEDRGFQGEEVAGLAQSITDAQDEGRLRAEHWLHLRCEVSADNVLDHFDMLKELPRVRLMSLMDHAPGQRQFENMEQYDLYYKTNAGLTEEQYQAFVARRIAASETYSDKHRRLLASHAKEAGISVASHDDATLEHVKEAKGFGVALAEFPTTFEAARASHEQGMSVLMGAPNVVRGGSHSGNIAAKELAEAGVLDVLSSDYVPISLIHAPFILSDTVDAISLPDAIALVTDTPAQTVGMTDRGRFEPGLRADLVRVRYKDGVPIVRAVWRQGERIA